MPKRKDLTGQRFGRLTVTGFDSIDKFGRAVWNLLCDCGKEHKQYTGQLKRAMNPSCGCVRVRSVGKRIAEVCDA